MKVEILDRSSLTKVRALKFGEFFYLNGGLIPHQVISKVTSSYPAEQGAGGDVVVVQKQELTALVWNHDREFNQVTLDANTQVKAIKEIKLVVY